LTIKLCFISYLANPQN